MSEQERSLEHSAKIRAYRALFGLLESGLKLHIRRINALLYFEGLISKDTQQRADVKATLQAIGALLQSNENVFRRFAAVLLEATDVGPHLINKLTSCYEDQLNKERADPARAAEEEIAVYQEQNSTGLPQWILPRDIVVRVSHCRVVFQGVPSAGKTSLMHGVMNQPLPDAANSTILANLRSVRCKALHGASSQDPWVDITEDDQLMGSEEVLFSLLDCGGQPIFFDVLPAFLNHSTFFVLAFDSSQNLYEPVSDLVNNQRQQKDCGVLDVSAMSLLQRWMAFVQARMGGFEHGGYMALPPICLVGTHADHLAPPQGGENAARKLFENIALSFMGKEYDNMVLRELVVDSTTAGKGEVEDKGFGELRDVITDFVSTQPAAEIPVYWVHLRKVLLRFRRTKPVISLDEVYELAATCSVPRNEVPNALYFYYILGIFLFYPETKGLESVVILEPQWLLNRFEELFYKWKGKTEHQEMWALLGQYGILVEPLYVEVLQSVREHNITPQSLLDLLDDFLFATPIVTSSLHRWSGKVKEYFVPLMLEHRVPKGAFLAQSLPSSAVMKASPIHLTFPNGCVPPSFFVRLATCLAAGGAQVLFNPNIYRNQISMLIGEGDKVTITEHEQSVKICFTRHSPVKKLFRDSCQNLLFLLIKVFGFVHTWLPEAGVQLAFSCLQCKATASSTPSKAQSCFFTLGQGVWECLYCQMGHRTLPSHSQRFWLRADPDDLQALDVCGGAYLSQEERQCLSKAIPSTTLSTLVEELELSPRESELKQQQSATDLFCQWCEKGGDRIELAQALRAINLNSLAEKLMSGQVTEYHHSIDAETDAEVKVIAQDTPETSQYLHYEVHVKNICPEKTVFIQCSLTETNQSYQGPVSQATALDTRKQGTGQANPLDRPPKMNELLNKVAARATDKWKKIGYQLDIEHYQLKSISKNNDDDVDRYAEVFSLWERRGDPPFTWGTIIEALRAPIVGEERLAKELEEWLKTVT